MSCLTFDIYSMAQPKTEADLIALLAESTSIIEDFTAQLLEVNNQLAAILAQLEALR
jgi:hypothetical protein